MGSRVQLADGGASPAVSAAHERISRRPVRLPASTRLLLLLRQLLMMHLLLAMLLAMLLPGGRATGATVAAREYCLDEIVEMQCGIGEIVIIESAKFGRMQLGRCVITDYGYIGCGSDVTDILSGKCSGRRHCRIFNLEVLFSGTKVCPQDLKSYLEANFRCAKVVLPVQTISCLQGGSLTVPSTGSSSSGLIASITSYEHGVGDSSCPWVIDASPGQRINLTLMDFTEYGGPASSSGEQQLPGFDHNRRVCRELAVVEETTALKNLVTCNHLPRSNVVFASKTNRIKITFSARNLDEDQPTHFVLKYDVYGCVYPSALPSNTHLVVSTDSDVNDDAIIRIQCNHTDEFWTLRCDHRNGTWKGHLGNCTTVSSREISTFDRFSYGMSLLLILVVAVSICFIFLAFGLLCLYRSKRLGGRQQPRTKHCTVASTSSYSSSRSLDPSSKASTVPRTQLSNGRAIYCPLDPNCTILRALDDSSAAVFHTLQEPLSRRPIPVSTPLVPRAVAAQQLRVLRPPCTCAVRAGSVMPCSAGQTRPCAGGQPPRTLIMEDDCAPAAVTFSTFKPENEYGTPKPRVSRPPCHHIDPNCCSDTPQGTRRAPTIQPPPDICCQEPTIVTV